MTGAPTGLRGNRHLFALGFFLILFAIASSLLAGQLNLYVDEAYSLDTSSGSIGRTLRRSITFEEQPPLYFLCLNVWRILDDSIFHARALSLLFVIAGLMCYWSAMQLLFDSTLLSVCAFLPLLFHPLVLWASLEVRVYALVFLIASSLLYLTVRVLLLGRLTHSALLSWSVISILAFFTFYYSLILSLAVWVSLLCFLDDRRSRLKLVAGIGILAAAVAPLYAVVHEHFSRSVYQIVSQSTVWQDTVLLRRHYSNILYKGSFEPFVNLKRLLLAAMIVLPVLVAWRYRLRGVSVRLQGQTTAIAAVLLLTAMALFGLIRIAGEENAMADRYSMFFLPFVAVFPLLVFQTSFGGRSVLLVAAILALFSLHASVDSNRYLAKTGDWKRAAAHIEQHEEANQPIIVYRPESVLPFRHHYRGLNAVVPVPSEPDMECYNVRSWKIEDWPGLLKLLERSLRTADAFWLLIDHQEMYRGVRFSHDRLTDLLDTTYLRLNEDQFYGSSVLKYRIPAPR